MRAGAPPDPGDLDAAVRGAVEGSSDAVTVLFRWLNPPLVRYLEGSARGHGDDLATETWMAAARTIGKFRGDAPAFRRWLFAIARRQLVDHWRRQGSRPSQAADPADLAALRTATACADAEDDALAAISADDALAFVTRVLPTEQAQVVLLRVVAGLSADEVGTVIGKRAGAVRVIQHRALAVLREALDGV